MKLLMSVGLIFLLSNCGCSKVTKNNLEQNNNIQNQGTIKMVRQKTDSGLEYEIIQEGAGITPEPGQDVTVHYTGYLDNNGELGTKFDSSVDRGRPFTFTIGVGQVIEGWDEGVMDMKVGEKRRLIIPSNLGYGARGAGRLIPPHSKLIFDVELLKID